MIPKRKKDTLKAKERVILAFNHQETDRVPIYGETRNVGFIEAVTRKKLIGTPFEMEKITAQAYNTVGIDMIRSMMIPKWGLVKGELYDIQWDGYLNWKVGGDRALSLDEACEYLKRSADSPLESKELLLNRINEVKRIQRILGEETLFVPQVSASCLEGLYHRMGLDNFSVIMYESPDLIDAALDTNMNKALAMTEMINDEYDGPVVHCSDDLGMKNTTIFSPSWLREHVFPKVKVVADKIKEGGKFFSFHSCGNVTTIVPDLIALGVDALNPLEITAGMDLAKMKEVYGEELVLIGNANANIIQLGSPEEVRGEIRRCFDEGASGGGYFLNGGFPQGSSAMNILAYFDEAHQYTGWRR